MKTLRRYAVIDEYTLEELRLKYRSADSRGRIALLRLISRHTKTSYNDQVPYEIAVLAASDPDARVRHWLVLNVEDLSYWAGFDWAKYLEASNRLEPEDRFLEFAKS